MAQKLIQTQTQKLSQQQRLSQQQMLMVKMLEMPLNELEDNIRAEIDDNPALETADPESEEAPNTLEEGTQEGPEDESFEQKTEREEREEALDEALQSIGMDDEMPVGYAAMNSYRQDNGEDIIYGDTVSFYDKLKEQMAMEDLSAVQQRIVEYLIGSLDNDGLLRKSLDTIADELAIYHGIDVTEAQIGQALAVLQTFDPPGIGARSLQECLLLQVERREESRLKELEKQVIAHHFTAFTHKHWHKIQQDLGLTDSQTAALKAEILRLNPKPGASLGETEGRSIHQITPDFIVETAEDGTITFALNHGNVPELQLSPAFSDMVEAYKNNKEGMNRQAKEALLYAKEKVDKARGFIEAVRQRRQTLTQTMKAIIQWQRPFFLYGDESDLQPMILKDIARATGLDISTISRAANVKYVQTKWGIFPLKHFFSDSYTGADGEATSVKKLRMTLKDIIDKEPKDNPKSDEELADEMRKLGWPVARRTIAKYRQLLGIPVARLRKA